MKIELNDDQVSTILGIIHGEYMNKKVYFSEHPNEVEGLVTPQEVKETYNSILEQAQQEGGFLILDPIKDKDKMLI